MIYVYRARRQGAGPPPPQPGDIDISIRPYPSPRRWARRSRAVYSASQPASLGSTHPPRGLGDLGLMHHIGAPARARRVTFVVAAGARGSRGGRWAERSVERKVAGMHPIPPMEARAGRRARGGPDGQNDQVPLQPG